MKTKDLNDVQLDAVAARCILADIIDGEQPQDAIHKAYDLIVGVVAELEGQSKQFSELQDNNMAMRAYMKRLKKIISEAPRV